MVALGLVALACAPAADTPSPRPIVISTGARLSAAPDRMNEVDDWVRAEMENIQEDPTFLVVTEFLAQPVYPWEGLEINADTVKVSLQGTAVDARTPYMIYGHLPLMNDMGRLDEWLPDAVGLEGFELERAILQRVSDVWLYGRTVFDAAPHLPLEELIYATENGYLDAFILTARADEFPDQHERWRTAIPNGEAQYLAWFEQTFQDLPPGMRSEPTAPQGSPGDAQADTSGVAVGLLP